MSISLPIIVSVVEGERMVEVCATLSAMEGTERDLTIVFATGDDTGNLSL